MIALATTELLELAAVMRGEDWADDLAGALIAADHAGWEWPDRFLYATRLMADEGATPQDLRNALRRSLKTAQSDPDAYDRGAALARELLAAKEDGQ